MDNNHRQLIEQTIKENDKYPGNEDLLEVFCSDVYKKSYLLLDSVSNVDNLKNYLVKVVDTSIVNILNQSGRDISPKAHKEINILESKEIKQKIIEEGLLNEANYNSTVKRKKGFDEDVVSLRSQTPQIRSLQSDIYGDIEDPAHGMSDYKINENVALRILSIVYDLHAKYPEKGYFQIFYSRYISFKKQAKVADELKISQGELSKRFYEMVRLIKEKL